MIKSNIKTKNYEMIFLKHFSSKFLNLKKNIILAFFVLMYVIYFIPPYISHATITGNESTTIDPLTQEEISVNAEREKTKTEIETLQTEIQNHENTLKVLEATLQATKENKELTWAKKNETTKKIQLDLKVEHEALNAKKQNLSELQNKQSDITDKTELVEFKKQEEEKIKDEISQINFESLLRAFLFLVALFAIGQIGKWSVKHIVEEVTTRKIIYGMINLAVGFFILLAILLYILSDITYFLPIIAIMGSSLAFGLQDIMKSFFAWFFISSMRGYKVGDIIDVQGKRGIVINISLFRTSIEELTDNGYTGSILVFPNKFFNESAITNLTRYSHYFFDDLSIICESKQSAENLSKKAKQLLESISTPMLGTAVKEWNNISDHPNPRENLSAYTVIIKMAKKEEYHCCIHFLTNRNDASITRQKLYDLIQDTDHVHES